MIKEVSETIKNEAKEQKEGFLGMLFGALGATGKGAIATSQGRGALRAS